MGPLLLRNDAIFAAARCVWTAFLIAFPAWAVAGFAQADNQETAIKPPSEETFLTRDAVLAPAWDAACPGMGQIFVKDCPLPHLSAYPAYRRLMLYTEDGEEWKHFSIDRSQEDYFQGVVGLSPLGKGPGPSTNHILLRLVGESDSWYTVEVNEKTRETKFALKSDLPWAKTPWSTWLNVSPNLVPLDENSKLRDAPDGRVLEEAVGIKLIKYDFRAVDGDWVKVQCRGRDGGDFVGWIRWRRGREMLVKWYGDSEYGDKLVYPYRFEGQ